MNSTKNLLELILEFSKFAGYKISKHKLVVFLYTNNEACESKFKKTIPLTIASKIIKNVEIYLTNEVKIYKLKIVKH